MSLRLVVFDVDGTLVDSQLHILDAMGRAYAAEGLEMPLKEQVLSIVGLSLPEAFIRLMPGADSGRIGRLVEAYKASFSEARGTTETPALYPGARATLERLSTRADILMGVATGKSRRGLNHMLAAHGLEGYFLTRQVADDHPSKPHPSMLEAALRETGCAPEHAVMIGDTSYDMEMGRAAGFRTLGVSWGYHAAEILEAAGADWVIESFESLIPTLEDLWGQG